MAITNGNGNKDREFRLAQRDGYTGSYDEWLNSDEQTQKQNEKDKTESDKIVELDEKYGKDPSLKAETVTDETGDPITSFKGIQNNEKDLENNATSIVSKVSNEEPTTQEDEEKAQSVLDKKLSEFDKRIEELEKKMSPNKLAQVGTILSALVSAATGGAIPFIPINQLTGDYQKNLMRIKTISEQYKALMNERSQLDIAENRSDPTVQENYDSYGKTKYSESGEKAANEDKNRITKEQAELAHKFEMEKASLASELQGKLMALTADLRNKAPAEQEKYIKGFLQDMSPKERSEFFKNRKKLGENMSDAQYVMSMIGQGVGIGTEVVKSGAEAIGNIIHK